MNTEQEIREAMEVLVEATGVALKTGIAENGPEIQTIGDTYGAFLWVLGESDCDLVGDMRKLVAKFKADMTHFIQSN